MALHVVMLLVPVEADGSIDAERTVKQAISHTPLAVSACRAEAVEGPEAMMPSGMLIRFGKWMSREYGTVVSAARKDWKAMESWGKFLCDMEEGVGES